MKSPMRHLKNGVNNQQNKLETVEEYINELNEGEDDMYGHYSWEQDLERTWEDVIDESGHLELKHDKISGEFRHNRPKYSNQNLINKSREIKHVRKGMIRNLVILMDMTLSMKEIDFKPNRLNCAIKHLQDFIVDYFQQSPISQLCLIALRNLSSEVISPFSSNPYEHIENLNKAKKKLCDGNPSLYTGLNKSLSLLSYIPPFGTKELLIIYGSLRTCDRSSLKDLENSIKSQNVRISCISFAPEIYALNKLCKDNKGMFFVAISSEHFRDLLFAHSNAILWIDGMQPGLVPMGFPAFKKTKIASLCSCHGTLSYEGYICCLCMSKVCSIPYKCKCCELHLIAPADISRSLYHLFLPSIFETMDDPNDADGYTCRGCATTFRTGGGKCPECNSFFCYDCDVYIHDQLHQCPFCIMNDVENLNIFKGIKVVDSHNKVVSDTSNQS